MPCPSATGACTMPADGVCEVPRIESSTLNLIKNVSLEANSSEFHVYWERSNYAVVPGAYDQVQVLYRESDGSSYFDRILRSTSIESITSPMLPQGEYTVWVAQQTDAYYDICGVYQVNIGPPRLDLSSRYNSVNLPLF